MRAHMKALAVVGVIGLALTSVAATPAGAVPSTDDISPMIVIEDDTALRQTVPPVMDVCVGGYGYPALGCFKKHGDRIFSYDRSPDGFAVYTDWENQLKKSNGDWQIYRKGRCNSTLGWEKYGECNKDFYENSTSPNAFGGKGSRIRIKACAKIKYLPDECTSWSSWITNNS